MINNFQVKLSLPKPVALTFPPTTTYQEYEEAPFGNVPRSESKYIDILDSIFGKPLEEDNVDATIQSDNEEEPMFGKPLPQPSAQKEPPSEMMPDLAPSPLGPLPQAPLFPSIRAMIHPTTQQIGSDQPPHWLSNSLISKKNQEKIMEVYQINDKVRF